MHRQNIKIKGIDSSETAIKVAKKNIQKFSLESTIHIVQADWNDLLEACDYDLLVANPPYIAKGDKNLDAFVEQYEPASALIAENNGLADLEKIIEIGCSILKVGGKIVLEHGFMQQEAVANLLKQYGYQVDHLGSDKHHPRFVIATF
jgi:release factor glutamine methyltransferase